MQQKLIIHLHARDLSHPSWVVVDETESHTVTLHGDSAALADVAKERDVVVLVPSEDVLLTTAILPKMNRSRLMQAIPYAVEEQVIDDVESMHFAVGEHRPDEPLTVAVVARHKMQEWVSLLASWQIVPDSLLPSVMALSDDALTWHAQVTDIAMVRTGRDSGFACDKENLHELLSLAIATAHVPPHDIHIDNSQSETLALTLSIPVEEQHVTAEKLLQAMATQLHKSVPLNLLQADFQNKKARRLPKLTSVWRVSVYLLGAWLVLLFLYPIVSFAILDKREADIKNEIAVIYKRHFPEASSVVAPKERMQQKLNKTTANLGDNRLLILMANVGKGLSKSSGVQLKRLDFQNNVMTLEISASSSDVFSAFTDSLSQQGLRVKQQNANLNGARVSATLQVE
jgi:general secretion pathway protein L